MRRPRRGVDPSLDYQKGRRPFRRFSLAHFLGVDWLNDTVKERGALSRPFSLAYSWSRGEKLGWAQKIGKCRSVSPRQRVISGRRQLCTVEQEFRFTDGALPFHVRGAPQRSWQKVHLLRRPFIDELHRRLHLHQLSTPFSRDMRTSHDDTSVLTTKNRPPCFSTWVWRWAQFKLRQSWSM